MKAAVIGSKKVTVGDLGQYLPEETTEIVSGGARGVVTCAREYTMANGIVLTKFLPAYEKYGQAGLRYSHPVVGAVAEQTGT